MADLAVAIETIELWVQIWADDLADIEEVSPCDEESRKVIRAVHRVLTELTALRERCERLEEAAGMLAEVYVYSQCGNHRPPDKRHALTPDIRDRIRDWLYA